MEKAFFPPKRLPARLQTHPIFVMIMLLKTARRISTEQYGKDIKQVHLPHYAILAMLEEYGALSQKQISQMIDTDPSDVVGLIDKLEEALMVTRKPDMHDRRRHSLQITALGRDELVKLDSRTAELNELFFKPLKPDERRLFEGYLRRLLMSETSTIARD